MANGLLTFLGFGRLGAKEKQAEEELKFLGGRPNLDLSAVIPGQIVNVETISGTLYRFMVMDLEDNCRVYLLSGNEVVFREFPVTCTYAGAGSAGVGFFKNRIVAGICMVFEDLPDRISHERVVTTSVVKTWWLETS